MITRQSFVLPSLLRRFQYATSLAELSPSLNGELLCIPRSFCLPPGNDTRKRGLVGDIRTYTLGQGLAENSFRPHHTTDGCSHQKSKKHCSICSRRQFSSSAVSAANKFVYEGPLSQTLRNLKGTAKSSLDQTMEDVTALLHHKVCCFGSQEEADSGQCRGPAVQRLSISGAAASVFGTPILVFNTAEAMPFAAQASICFTIASFGVFTTGLLHWFTSPYVHRLDFNRDTRDGEAKTLNLFAQPRQHRFRESDVRHPDTMRPQVTFEVDGKFFYLDANAFEDKELLERLTPPDPNAVETASLSEGDSKQ